MRVLWEGERVKKLLLIFKVVIDMFKSSYEDLENSEPPMIVGNKIIENHKIEFVRKYNNLENRINALIESKKIDFCYACDLKNLLDESVNFEELRNVELYIKGKE